MKCIRCATGRKATAVTADTPFTAEPTGPQRNRLIKFLAAVGRRYVLWLPWVWAGAFYLLTWLVSREYRVWLWNSLWAGIALTALIAWMHDRRLGPRVVVFKANRPVGRNGAERN